MPVDAALHDTRPIVVVGMHRSGTRLIAALLERLGVFMGADLQADAESVTFLRINEAVFHQCGTFWSEPLPVHVMLAQPEQLERLAGLVDVTLAGELDGYAGTPERRAALTAGMLEFGWKDPRNTFTLPLWNRLFPRCRVIHMLRHGVDVAASLARRQHAACLSASDGARPAALAVFEDHALGVLSSRRGWTLPEAFAMWEQYVEKARIESAALGERALEIPFEALLTEPAAVVPRIAEFCGVAVPHAGADALPAPAPDRAFAFRRDPELAAFAAAHRDALAAYGYTD